MSTMASLDQLTPPGPRESVLGKEKRSQVLGHLLVVYVILTFADGALRKWAFPSAAPLLYFAKDVVIVAGFVILAHTRSRVVEYWLYYCLILLVFASVQAMTTLESPILVAAGFRGLILFPLIIIVFASGVLQETAVRRASRCVVVLCAAQLPIVLMQISAPRDSFINRLLAQDGSDNLGLANEVLRPTGTFTSSAALTAAIVLALCLIATDLASSGRTLAMKAGPVPACLLLATTAVTGSRTAMAMAVVIVTATILAAARSAKSFVKTCAVLAAAVFVTILVLADNLAFTEALKVRLLDASAHEDSTGRVVGQLLGWVPVLNHVPLLGYGLGSSGNVSVALNSLSRGSWVESDLSRMVVEMGPPVGVVLIILRLGLAFFFAYYCLTGGRLRPVGWIMMVGLFWQLATGPVTGQGSIMALTGLGLGLALRLMNRPECVRDRAIDGTKT